MQSLLLIILIQGISNLASATPKWAMEDTNVRQGNILTLVCSGVGPSIGLARMEAIESCQVSAGHQVRTEIKVKSVAIETEKNTAYHQEVSSDDVLVGLDCISRREAIEQIGESYQLWVKCEFDLLKIKSAKSNQKQAESDLNSVSVADSLGAGSKKIVFSGFQAESGRYLKDINTALTITSIPGCSSLIVRGEKSRVIVCTENPTTIILDKSDIEIIVRSDGFLPKTVKLNQQRGFDEKISIVLDPK